MAALLVAIAVMGIAMSVAMPTWRHANQREREEELIFRGRQYVRAIQLYQRKFAAAYPADLDVLVKGKFLRRKYQDPMVEDGEFEVIYQGTPLSVSGGARGSMPQSPGQRGGMSPQQSGSTFSFDSRSGLVTQGNQGVRTAGMRGPIIGVRSRSTDESIRIYNGGTHYNEWQFIYAPIQTGPGQGQPGMRGGQGRPGGPGQQGTPGPQGMPGGRGGFGGSSGFGQGPGQMPGDVRGARGGRGPGG